MTNAGNTREFHISRMDYDIELSYVENAQNIHGGFYSIENKVHFTFVL